MEAVGVLVIACGLCGIAVVVGLIVAGIVLRQPLSTGYTDADGLLWEMTGYAHPLCPRCRTPLRLFEGGYDTLVIVIRDLRADDTFTAGDIWCDAPLPNGKHAFPWFSYAKTFGEAQASARRQLPEPKHVPLLTTRTSPPMRRHRNPDGTTYMLPVDWPDQQLPLDRDDPRRKTPRSSFLGL